MELLLPFVATVLILTGCGSQSASGQFPTPLLGSTTAVHVAKRAASTGSFGQIPLYVRLTARYVGE